jgi:hypothetical protein
MTKAGKPGVSELPRNSLSKVDRNIQLLPNDFLKKVYLARNQPLLVRLRRVYAATWRIFFQ